MTLKCVMKMWPKTWTTVLQEMYRSGFVLCLKCSGLPHESFLDAHSSACPDKL